ncbi:cytochrome P450 [Epithele typhae]|uniref:cytochrome P450 n=1 Tax=Epithele typhae TaxID=378194 RepID=UPI002007E638|nr:cytochrome P450 [Epithele typhae]KAH9929918.1 cytochrome P450 [Epithele typhae]
MAFLGATGRRYVCIQHLHEHYALDIVRIGPNGLSIRDPTAMLAILGMKGMLLKAEPLTMIAIQDTDEHVQRRRPYHADSRRGALKDYEVMVSRRARMLVDRLGETKGADVCLDEWFDRFSCDYMSDLAFGGGSELLSGTDKNNFLPALTAATTSAVFLSHVPWLGVYTLHVNCSALTKQRVHRGAATHDLFHHLQLIEDAVLTMVAGSDTVASTLTSLFACLVAHPAVHARLSRDTDGTVTRAHRDMAYLGALINETLRLFPPVPSGTQRQMAPWGPWIHCGRQMRPRAALTMIIIRYIPPGSALWVHVWSMHRDARSFSDPTRFWPERWLPVDAHDSKPTRGFAHDEAAFNPFSYGPLNCVGKALGLQEIWTVVCAVLQRFEGACLDHFVSVRGKVRVVLEAHRVVRNCDGGAEFAS